MADRKSFGDISDTSLVPELRLVLVGPGGMGKSATGNTILGRKAFREHLMARAPDNQCRFAKTIDDGQNILVVDTPALLYSEESREDDLERISQEIAKCVLLSAPGPHAILLVIEIGRLTGILQRATRLIEEMFGVEAKRYIIIVLTGRDGLEDEDETLEDYFASVPSYMSAMFKKFPIFAINNKADNNNKRHQAKELLEVVTERNSVHMSNELYESVEEILLRAEGESVIT